jgi:hypothetical protein
VKIRYLPYIILQWTWGIIQTLAGLIMFLISVREKHTFYKGAIATFWKRPFGISLGMFIFIPPKARFYNPDKYDLKAEEIRERLLVHEYGHTYQSLILGPLYFPVVGISSVIWGMVKKPEQSYFSFYAEKWANHLGEKFTGRKSMENIDV